MEARLVLEDGTEFEGQAAGAPISRAGEVVFSTGMVGYEQSLTDPSYEGQILTFTYPLIGNWGVGPRQFWESQKIHVAGVIISDLTTAPSHWQALPAGRQGQKNLDAWLREENIPAIVGIDTRALTQKLREKGVMLGKIVVSDQGIDFWDPNAENLVERVSTREVIIHSLNTKYEARNTKQYQNRNDKNSKRFEHFNFDNLDLSRISAFEFRNSPQIALLDCGVKQNIITSLVSRGATVYQLPWDFDPFDNQIKSDSKSASLLAIKNMTKSRQNTTTNLQSTDAGRRPERGGLLEEPTSKTPAERFLMAANSRQHKETTAWTRLPRIDGLVISNGPGDPKMCGATINIIRKAIARKIPTFGICLGHQLMTLAAGGDTYKLKFGHRSQNQPAIEEKSKRCYITTQNHGYATGLIPPGFRPWFTNANDNTNEGIIHQKLPFFSVQFHPEATPGPTDTQWLFDYFMEQFR